jgi:hypothetical protein
MKIVYIFEPHLSAFHYVDQTENEFERLMDLWTDVNYLRNYAKENGITAINGFVQKHLNDAEAIQDLLDEINSQKQLLEVYFKPLHETEIGVKFLSLQKGKIRKNGLRIYAIKIHENCYVITGGAIKMSWAMQDHPETNNELKKLEAAKAYLKGEGIVDDDSFYELIDELE